MNVWYLTAFIILVILFILLCLLAFQILRRQNQLAARLSAQEKAAAQQAAASTSQAKAHFESVSSQMQMLGKEQAQNSALMDAVYDQMDAINKVMTNTKMRGTWGEYQMEQLIRAYAGENTALYEVQFHLENGRIADGIFHLPGSDKVLCIDSKFPMENYLRMADDPAREEYYQKEFDRNMKKHIDDVSGKYITPQTASQALLFIPSEAIYQYICSGKAQMLQYALQKHVLLVSPTTLVGVVYTLLAAGKDLYQAEHFEEIEKELDKLQKEFAALQTKADKASRALDTAVNTQQTFYAALDKSLKHLSRVLEGKDLHHAHHHTAYTDEMPENSSIRTGKEVGHVPERSRFEYPEEQSEPLSGAEGVPGRSGFLSNL